MVLAVIDSVFEMAYRALKLFFTHFHPWGNQIDHFSITFVWYKKTIHIDLGYEKPERAIGKNEKLESFKLKSHLERYLPRPYDYQSEVTL